MGSHCPQMSSPISCFCSLISHPLLMDSLHPVRLTGGNSLLWTGLPGGRRGTWRGTQSQGGVLCSEHPEGRGGVSLEDRWGPEEWWSPWLLVLPAPSGLLGGGVYVLALHFSLCSLREGGST